MKCPAYHSISSSVRKKPAPKSSRERRTRVASTAG